VRRPAKTVNAMISENRSASLIDPHPGSPHVTKSCVFIMMFLACVLFDSTCEAAAIFPADSREYSLCDSFCQASV
jgi:hypothetical protein